MMTQRCSYLLSLDEVISIFQCSELYEMRSFYVIEKNSGTYNFSRSRGTHLEESRFLSSQMKQGNTIIVKNLEQFNAKIQQRCQDLGKIVNVHMYLVPPLGESSFDFHKDDRDVTIHIIYGRKKFLMKKDNEIQQEVLGPGDELRIPKGVYHKAVPQGASCLLSFGSLAGGSYEVPIDFSPNDLS